jgi:hypothetical protein
MELDLRSPAPVAQTGHDADDPTGAAAAFAILSFMACTTGVLVGALAF